MMKTCHVDRRETSHILKEGCCRYEISPIVEMTVHSL